MVLSSYTVLFATATFGICTVSLLLLFVKSVYQLAQANMAITYEGILAQRTEELVRERIKVDNLLQRVLPEQTINELQQRGKVATERHGMVSVLFADIEGFTMIADSINPERLIDSLDRFFFNLDDITKRHDLEKIKTIGDAYMCAGGVPKHNHTNPIDAVLAALEMQEHMKRLNLATHSGDNSWGLRIGVNTGQVISGVVGRDKLSYDIWGSGVNLASRMESSGEAGRVNISYYTHMLVKDFFDCTCRGEMPVKNNGRVKMYFVDGIKPELSLEGKGLTPNRLFTLKLQQLRLLDVEDYALNLLENNLPSDLYYHNVKHTLDVYTQAELIGRNEGVSEEDLLILRTAALFHDIGHIADYQTHEEIGVRICSDALLRFHYTPDQIKAVCNLIMATKMPVHPETLLEKIICDADCDYLGRDDYIPVANKLYDELKVRGLAGNLSDWVRLQIDFLRAHRYYTQTAIEQREENKQQQLSKLLEWYHKAQEEEKANR